MKVITDTLLRWYSRNHRKLPWRSNRDPYRIWLSEIILQQTRVSQGMHYYLDFVSKYPDIEAFANASEDEVLKMWQGLGYYSRARNMLKAARQIMEKNNGRFPDNYLDLMGLQGVGEYTAAAIASIAFGEAVPVVDGNVKRVIARLYGIGEKERKLYTAVKDRMGTLIDEDNPGDFNQAVMEFGALVCTPRSPDCDNCVLKMYCMAYKLNIVDIIPLKQVPVKTRKRYFNYLILIEEGGSIIFNKRNNNDIWKNLYDFPLIETGREIAQGELPGNKTWNEWLAGPVTIAFASKPYRHQLTHQKIIARFYIIYTRAGEKIPLQAGWERIPRKRVKTLAVPRLIEKFMDDHQEYF